LVDPATDRIPDGPARARFEALVLQHLDAAYRLARWLARDDHDARDIVQESCLRAWLAFSGLRGNDARPWLLAIVRNTCFTWLGRRREEALPEESEIEDEGPGSAGPEERALRAEERARVDGALRRLPADLREVLVLRELEEYSYREISAIAGIPMGTVMSRLSRARERFAQALGDGSQGRQG